MPDSLAPEASPERYRNYLRVLLRARAGLKLNSKVDLSGVIQVTLLEAHRILDQWLIWSEEAQLAWLRTALGNNYLDEVRRFQSAARDVGREIDIEPVIDDSAARFAIIASEVSSPSTRASRNEQLVLLADSLYRLPDDQRLAIEHHHLGELSIAETAERMGKTDQSVVGLLFRGLRRLRELMGADPT